MGGRINTLSSFPGLDLMLLTSISKGGGTSVLFTLVEFMGLTVFDSSRSDKKLLCCCLALHCH